MNITFKHAKSLESFLSFYVKNSPNLDKKWKDWEPPTDIEARIIAFKEFWAKYETKVVYGIEEALNLKFERDIDVYFVAGVNKAMSDPLILRASKNHKFILLKLTHELIHRIFEGTDFKFPKILLNRTGNNIVDNHIIVYAVMRHVFKDDPQLIERIMEDNFHPNYIKAFELSKNYEEILKYFRDNK